MYQFLSTLRNIYLYLILAYSIATSAQPEFAPIGAEWTYDVLNYQWHPPFNKYYGRYKIVSEKDSIINNFSYKKLVRYTIKNIGFKAEKIMWIRQDAEKIFLHADQDYLLYDFGAKMFDTFFSHVIDEQSGNVFPIKMSINYIRFGQINGENYKVQKVDFACSLGGNYGFTYLHQKYGCILLNDLFYNENMCLIDFPLTVNLRCYNEPTFEINFDSIPCDSIRPDVIKTKTDKSQSNEISIYPTLVDNIIHLDSRVLEIVKVQIFNANGVKLCSEQTSMLRHSIDLYLEYLKPGLYFIEVLQSNGASIMKKFFKE